MKFSYAYDDGDRLIQSTDTINSNYGDFTIRSAYDDVSNLTGLKAGTESTLTYNYNNRDDLTDIDLPGGAADEIGFGYDDARNRTSITMPGSVGNIFKLDEANRVTSVTVDTASGSDTYSYTHDANGNILSTNDINYLYDDLNRLTDWYNG